MTHDTWYDNMIYVKMKTWKKKDIHVHCYQTKDIISSKLDSLEIVHISTAIVNHLISIFVILIEDFQGIS